MYILIRNTLLLLRNLSKTLKGLILFSLYIMVSPFKYVASKLEHLDGCCIGLGTIFDYLVNAMHDKILDTWK